MPVTNTENRNAEVVDGRVKYWSTVDVHTFWSTRQNDGSRIFLLYFARRDAVRHDF